MKKLSIYIFTLILCAALFSFSALAAVQKAPAAENITVDIADADSSPVLDGIIKDGEYTRLEISSDMYSYVVGSENDWLRAKRFTFDVYACHDSEYLYLAVNYKLSTLYYIADASDKDMWAQSCVMLSLAPRSASGREALELGMRINENGVMSSYIWNYNGENPYSTYGNYFVSHNGTDFVYELRVPFSSFGASSEGESVALCVCVSSGDYYNDNRYLYVQLGKGISGFSDGTDAVSGKYVSLFPTARLLSSQSESETEPEQTEEPTKPNVPTSDVSPAIILIPSAGILLTVPIFAAVIKRRSD